MQVPAFEGSDGTLLTESNAIAYYVANEELRGGSDAAARAQVCIDEKCPSSLYWYAIDVKVRVDIAGGSMDEHG